MLKYSLKMKYVYNKITDPFKYDELPCNQVRFEIGDLTKHNYPAEYFDYIYSRDVFLHVQDKNKLANKLKVIEFNSIFDSIIYSTRFVFSKTWLKPGGKLFFTDYTWYCLF